MGTRFSKLTFVPVMLLLPALVLSSCNGIFAGIYDTEGETSDGVYGFLTKSDGTSSGTVYIDATSYTAWTYIDFHAGTITVTGMDDSEAPDSWDIAVHRYDAKTNGASVLETTQTGLELFLSTGSMPTGDYVEDVWTTEQIIVDMSGMMDGVLGYAESWYNEELSKWIDVDLSVMPPIYTMSYKVYALKLADGTNLALKLASYLSGSTKGYLTIEYIYPLEF